MLSDLVEQFERYRGTQLYICVVLSVLVPVLAGKFLQSLRRMRVPRVGKNPWICGAAKARDDFFKNGRSLTKEGYFKFKNSMFLVQTADMERVIISNRYIEELRALPESHLSSKIAQCERHMAWYNSMDVVKQSDLHADVCRVQLTQHLGKIVADMVEEVDFVLEKELSDCDNVFRSIAAYPSVLSMVNRIVSRPLVGYPLCRSEEWLRVSLGYTVSAFLISAALRPRLNVLRPFVYFFLRARRTLKADLAAANAVVCPVLESRKPKEENIDILQWLLDGAKGRDSDPRRITNKTLFIALAAMNASTMAIVHVLYDLCAMPQYIEPLRDDIKNALEKAGGWSLAALQNMERLDSFVKESQRLNHPGLFSFNRKVLKSVTLKGGTTIPAGTFIAMPTYFIARDPDNYDSPETFRPWRFFEQRQADSQHSSRYQLTSTAPENLAFGYGRFACPGRFFSAAQIKLLLAKLLLKYEFQFPDGQTERPENVFVDERIMPSRTQEIAFRRRT